MIMLKKYGDELLCAEKEKKKAKALLKLLIKFMPGVVCISYTVFVLFDTNLICIL